MTKINFGSGPYPIAGWINVDLDPAGRPEVVADLARTLPFATGVADFIHTEDFIAQLDPMPLSGFLRECRRILKPDGVMRMLTPDLARFARMYLEDPQHLVWIWNTFVGVPLETGTACEVLNLGMRLAGPAFNTISRPMPGLRWMQDSTPYASPTTKAVSSHCVDWTCAGPMKR
jgi:SAM-dependent methyltransferase